VPRAAKSPRQERRGGEVPTITEGFVAPMRAAVAHAANAGSFRWSFRNKKAQQLLGLMSLIDKGISGRGERIRTSGLYVPNVALYQAKLHPDGCKKRESSFVVT
jgi:hypothetical protein